MIPLQIRITDNETRLTASGVPYGVAMISELEFAFIVDVDGEMVVMTPYEFACRDASCRPPGSGGTGGSRKAGSGGAAEGDGDPGGSNASRGGLGISVGKAAKGKTAAGPGIEDMSPKAQEAALKVINSIPGMENIRTVKEAVDAVAARLDATITIATQHGLLHGNLDGSPSAPYDAARIQATSRWYDVANTYVGAIADKYGFNHAETSAAVFATLSPGAPWPSNVRNGEHVMMYVGQNKKVGEEGVRDIQYRAGRVLAGERDKLKKAGESLEAIDAEIARVGGEAHFKKLLKEHGGKKFNDLDEDTAAFLIQGNIQRNALKEVNIDPHPDGTYSVSPGTGKAIIQSTVNFSKAIRMARADKNGATEAELSTMISSAVSQESKARAFFMNIAHPNDSRQNAVTLDTHAYGALTGVPLSLNTSGRFFVSSKEVGYANSYPIMRAAMIQVSARLESLGMGRLPARAVQSVVWEMERAIMPDRGKSAVLKAGDGPGTVSHQAAELYRQGKVLEAKTLISRAAGGIA